MGRLFHLRGDPHQETQMLLPWYATRQADPADRMLVEAHIATCATCRDDLARERQLSAAVRELPHANDEAWERLAGSLAEHAGPRAWWQRPVRVAWFVAAQAAVVLLCIGLFVTRQTVPPAPTYRVLGDAPVARPGNMLVMFASTTSKQAVRGAIEAANAHLVGGPSEAGAYLLAVAPAERNAALATLRARPEVTLAQPVDATPR
jgi:hypothetical protein